MQSYLREIVECSDANERELIRLAQNLVKIGLRECRLAAPNCYQC